MSNNKEKKNDDGIVGGIILIVIGLIALMVTFFDIEIVWSEIARLWPVFIIIFGISILPFNKFFKSILVIAMILISFLLYYNGVKDDKDFTCENIQQESDVDVQEFSEPFINNIKEADVEINYGAGTLNLNVPVKEFVKASNASNYIVQDFSVKYENDKADIVFDLTADNLNVTGKKSVSNNFFNIALNENPLYNFEINVGASNMNFNLSDYKVADIDVNGGACDIYIKLGDLHNYTDVSINTGVSDIKIGIPENSGCRVECESVLSNRSFDGFMKKSSGVYETTNYSSAQNIVNIEFAGAISDFEIYRY